MSAPLSVTELIDQQEAFLVELEKLLLTEKDVLTKQNPLALTQVTEQKQQLLLQIEQQDKQISIHPHFKKELDEGHHQDILARINEKLEHCKELNQVNGNIIGQSANAVERMRSPLLERNSKSSMTYDAKGKKSGGLSRLGIKA